MKERNLSQNLSLYEALVAIFRCDASLDMGSGHVMRCLTLADALNEAGWECLFSCTSETLEIVPSLSSKGYTVIDPEELSEPSDLLIVDHYKLDQKFETKSREWAKRILVIDDLADRRHDCDILLDQTYGREASDYTELVPEHCTILAGSEYALLRPQFRAAREESLLRRTPENIDFKRVLVSLGATNMFNVTSKILHAIELFNEAELRIDVVLGAQAAHLEEVKKQIETMNETSAHQVQLHIDVKDMAGIMTNADLAIGAGGTTSWERCCLGLPALIIEIAENQKTITRLLADAGAIINLGWHDALPEKKISDLLCDFVKNPGKLLQLSDKASNICDGLGADRVARELRNE